ncbi:hypothetical protein [Homoserinimonas sp. OAct 916]|uniref:hypothetical protein n=1 Tax=Homoserinimonas sp. OAct 916 TaxID=2211450 RepID=UPI001300193B|nr:hypothetical protein [Homoserinimonas sp. OAct 916]
MTPTDEASPLTPAQASLVAAALDAATGDIDAVDGGILTEVHQERQCVETDR